MVDRHRQLEIQQRGSSEPTPIPLSSGDIFREQLEEFAACIREKRQPEVGGPEAVSALAVVHAAIRSAEPGRAVCPREVLEDRR